MAKLVLTLDTRFNQPTTVKRFVADTNKIVGLVEDDLGVKVTLDVAGKISETYVSETFDEISDVMIYSDYADGYESVE